jgi:hypothetical protein
VLQQRIDSLENLVKNLMAQSQKGFPGETENDSPNDTASNLDTAGTVGDPANLPCSAGTTMIDGSSRSIYKAANDWSDVLQEVRNTNFLSPFGPGIILLQKCCLFLRVLRR